MMDRRRLMIGASTGLIGSMIGFVPNARAAGAMAAAAAAWLDGLAPAVRKAAQRAFDDPARLDWHFVPRQRPGVPIGRMSEDNRHQLRQMLGTVLSLRGIEMVEGVYAYERVLYDLSGGSGFRDPENYAMIVFGAPGDREPWAWRFEGHHLSVSVTVAPGSGIAVTPTFFGSNPHHPPEGHSHPRFHHMHEQEDRAFALIRSLEGKLREDAIISDRSLGDIVSGPGRETALRDAVEGVTYDRLSLGQRDGLGALMNFFIGAMRDDIALSVVERIQEAGTDNIRFAWGGSLEPGKPHYFRVHSPRLIMEYDNTQNGANHVHTVWIDPQDPLGVDTLARHHKAEHKG